MERNTMKYKVKQYLMFAGVSTVLFCAVVIVPFIYGLYLTFTSWDGVSKEKPFVGLANYISTFQDAAYWQALGRTLVYSVIAVILVNVVAFFLAYLLTSGIKGQNFFRAGFFIPNLIGGIVLGYIWQLFVKWYSGDCWKNIDIFFSIWILGISHSDVLAADRLYDDHLCSRTAECTYGSDRSSRDRWSYFVTDIIQSENSDGYAIHHYLYFPDTHKRI